MTKPTMYRLRSGMCALLSAAAISAILLPVANSQNPQVKQKTGSKDAVAQAQTTKEAAASRPEQQKSPHDGSAVFGADHAPPSSQVFKSQPKEGKVSGFDFVRDPLNADRPKHSPEEIMAKEIANKSNVMNSQAQLLARR